MLLGLVIFAGCDKKNEVENIHINMEFSETKCANPWDVQTSDPNYLPGVKTHIENEGLTVYQIDVRRVNEAPLYGDCTVLSGRIVNIEIPEKDTTKAKTIGFTVVE